MCLLIHTNLSSFNKLFKTENSLIFKIDDVFDSRAFSITTSSQYAFEDSPAVQYTDYMDYEGSRSGRSFLLSFEYRFGDYKENKYQRDSHGHNHDDGMDMSY